MSALVDYMLSNGAMTGGMVGFWAVASFATNYPKAQIVPDSFAVMSFFLGIAVFVGYLDELFLMSLTVTFMVATVVPLFATKGYDMVFHHVVTVILICMGCSSEQALQQKFMTITLQVELSSPFISHWRRHPTKARLGLMLAAFFVVRIAGFGAYMAYLVFLAATPNELFDPRPVHRGIVAVHALLFAMFIFWFQKMVKKYIKYDEKAELAKSLVRTKAK